MKREARRVSKKLTKAFQNTLYNTELPTKAKQTDNETLELKIKKLKNENVALTCALQEARCMSKKLLYILYEHDIINRNQSIFSLFKEVQNLVKIGKLLK